MEEAAFIKYLSELNPGHHDFPVPYDPEEQDRRAKDLLSALRQRFPSVTMSMESQDQSLFATYELSSEALRDPSNPYPNVRLSRFEGRAFEGLVTAFLEWDFTADSLQRIKSAAAECGCTYVPFTLFASPESFVWKDIYYLDVHRLSPPAGQITMKHPELWSSLFDYL